MAQPSGFKMWLPAMVSMVCLGLGMGLIGIYGFFANPLTEEFGVTRAAFNAGPLFLLLMPAFLGPIAGRLADRISIRYLLLSGVTIATTSLFVMSQVRSLTAVLLCFIGCAVGLVFYGPITVNAFLIKHYRGRAGRALAIAAMGVSLSSAALPGVMGQMMEIYSWRTSLSSLAIAMAVVLVVSIYFGLAGTEKMAESDVQEQPGSASSDIAYLRQSAFWFIGLAVAIAFMSTLIVSICYPSHFMNLGFSQSDAGLFLMAGGMAGLTGKLIVAAVIDRFKSNLKFFAIFLLLVQVAGLIGLLMADTWYLTILSVMLLGFGGGAFIPMHPILNAGYFDALIIGRVGGSQMPMMLPVGLVGLPLSGYVFDQTGSYQLVFSVLILLFLIGTILLLKLPKIDVIERA